jgi:hypothetical protein
VSGVCRPALVTFDANARSWDNMQTAALIELGSRFLERPRAEPARLYRAVLRLGVGAEYFALRALIGDFEVVLGISS